MTGARATTFCKRVSFEDTVESGGNIAQVNADFVADMHGHDPGCHQEGDHVSVVAFFLNAHWSLSKASIFSQRGINTLNMSCSTTLYKSVVR